MSRYGREKGGKARKSKQMLSNKREKGKKGVIEDYVSMPTPYKQRIIPIIKRKKEKNTLT